MKKSIFNLAVAALFLAGTLSCTKEEPEIPADGELIDLEIVGTHEQFTPQDPHPDRQRYRVVVCR